MSEATQQPQSALQRQIAQMAAELAAHLEQQARQAPLGTVLDACEDLLLGRGRQFLRDCLAATLQQQADEAEKRGPRPHLYLRPRLPQQGHRLPRVPDRHRPHPHQPHLLLLPPLPHRRLPRR